MAYSGDMAGVSTPELRMKLTREAGNRLVVFEEPLELASTLRGALARSRPCGQPPYQRPHLIAYCYPLGPGVAPSLRGCREPGCSLCGCALVPVQRHRCPAACRRRFDEK